MYIIMRNPHSFLTLYLGGLDPPFKWARAKIFLKRFVFWSLIYLVYAGYLWFQLYSHTNLYKDEGEDIAKSTIYSPRTRHFRNRKNKDVEAPGSTSILAGPLVAEAERKLTPEVECTETPEVELETPQMTVWMTILLLAVVTVVSYLLYTLAYLSHWHLYTAGSSHCWMARRLH